jgi:RimJ/RimL family protein N-acetyltransferase
MNCTMPGWPVAARRATEASERKAIRTSMAKMTVLTTQRLILREMSSADLDDIAALLGDEDVMRYYPRPKTRSEAQGWINWNQALYRDHGFGLWAVVLRSTGEFIGDCGLTLQRVADSDTDEVEVGYHVGASFQGYGYDTEAASAARDFARDRLGLHRLIAIINPANLPSQAVARKIGLKPERHSTVHGQECVIYAGELQSPTGSDGVTH